MITMKVPGGMKDLSEYRQVPDHQECFAEPETDRSLIVEIVEYEKEVHAKGCEHAALFHFRDLAKANEAVGCTESPVIETGYREALCPGSLTPMSQVTLLFGVQGIAKDKDKAEAANQVHLCLCDIAIPEYETEVLVTMNTPLAISEKSSSFGKVEGAAGSSKGERERLVRDAVEAFKDVVASFKVVDYRLFGHG
ncbi:putative Mog1-like ran guanine nucleotide release factor [Chloropicon primus]|nr:putative Mog1-like ran guanine nucleotide release factor [Chloropicon primus]UPR05325.1 putative Mog1-like ran guanine nucleotide release factor [Chloropicon primus]|eukprot:QDZ26108.1 putative Mog1-like ran guanine nucleotide release factor [Chloropicon primus]